MPSVFSASPGLPGFSSMFGKKKKRLEISAPSNFEHRVHTGFDPREQKFTGLPQQWQSLLADTANRPKPMVDPSYITPIQLAPMKVERERTEGVQLGGLIIFYPLLFLKKQKPAYLCLHSFLFSTTIPSFALSLCIALCVSDI